MALFKITYIGAMETVQGKTIEKGMSIEIASRNSNPLSTNEREMVNAAFIRKYGIDLKKINRMSVTYFKVEKITS